MHRSTSVQAMSGAPHHGGFGPDRALGEGHAHTVHGASPLDHAAATMLDERTVRGGNALMQFQKQQRSLGRSEPVNTMPPRGIIRAAARAPDSHTSAHPPAFPQLRPLDIHSSAQPQALPLPRTLGHHASVHPPAVSASLAPFSLLRALATCMPVHLSAIFTVAW